ncbi:MAG: hypothetical protein JO255_07420 [Alphaproteobacteria bacterium]|nr:hypothetical protein [Alphaproteobacteria bacterium]
MTPPPLVYAAKTPLTELQTSELFVVVSLRLWVSAYLDPTSLGRSWRSGFDAAGLDDAGRDAFDALLRTVAATALRTLDVRCPRCRELGEDEGRLLQLLSLLQRRRQSGAAAVLSDWMPSAAARLALVSAQGFAASLQDGGLSIPLRHAEAAGARSAASACADRGLALVQ